MNHPGAPVLRNLNSNLLNAHNHPMKLVLLLSYSHYIDEEIKAEKVDVT